MNYLSSANPTKTHMKYACICRLTFTALLAILLTGCEQKKFSEDPHEVLKLGWQQLSSAEYDSAEEAFQHASAHAAAGSRDFLMARFGLANTFQNRKPVHDYDAATAVYKEIVVADKGGEVGSWSALAIVRMQHLRLYEVGHRASGDADSTLPADSELDVIRKAYETVAADFPGTDAADEANMFAGASYIEEVSPESIDRGIAYLRTWLQSHPNSRYVGHAWGLISSGYEIEAPKKPELWSAMLDALLEQVKLKNPEKVNVSADYYRVARVAEIHAHRPDVAKEYYWKLKKKYPTDARIFYCNRALKQLGESVPDDPDTLAKAKKGGSS